MKIIINFSQKAFDKEIVKSGKAIAKKYVADVNMEELTEEQRALLIRFSFAKHGNDFSEPRTLCDAYRGSNNALEWDEYITDPMTIVDTMVSVADELKTKDLAEVCEYNRNAKYDEYYKRVKLYRCSKSFFSYNNMNGSSTEYVYESCDMNVVLDEFNKLTGSYDFGVPYDELLGILMPEFEKMVAHANDVARKKQEEKEKREREEAEEEQQRMAADVNRLKWVEKNATPYLKSLVDEGFDYYDVFRDEYAIAKGGVAIYDGSRDNDDFVPSEDVLADYVELKRSNSDVRELFRAKEDESEDDYYGDDELVYRYYAKCYNKGMMVQYYVEL